MNDLIEAMARAIQKRAETLDPGVTWEEWEPEAAAALAALRAARPDVAAVLDGEAIAVPREATWEMVRAAGYRPQPDPEPLMYPAIYRAMLAASPYAQQETPRWATVGLIRRGRACR